MSVYTFEHPCKASQLADELDALGIQVDGPAQIGALSTVGATSITLTTIQPLTDAQASALQNAITSHTPAPEPDRKAILKSAIAKLKALGLTEQEIGAIRSMSHQGA